MLKSLALVAFTMLGVASVPVLMAPPLDAYQQKPIGNLDFMVHLEPHDSPTAGKPSATWFMLMQRNGSVINPASCDCKATVYNVHNQSIAPHFPLTITPVSAHRQEQAIRTTITFPQPGNYTVVLSGRSTNGSFNPFVLKLPIHVRP